MATEQIPSALKAVFEKGLGEVFDHYAHMINGAIAGSDPQVAIKELRNLAHNLDVSKAYPTPDICATVAKEMMPRLVKLGIKKGDRWFRKYLDAKYKRPQQKEDLPEPEKPRETEIPKPGNEELGCSQCGYGRAAHTVETQDRCLFYVDPRAADKSVAKKPKKAKSLSASLKEHAKKNIKEAEKKGKIPFSVEYINQHITKDGRKKCLNCHHLRGIHDDSDTHCGASKCQCRCFVDPEITAINMGLVTEDDRTFHEPSIESVKKQVKKETVDEVVKQVERTREEGYNAYQGQAGLKLDQRHFSEKPYTFAEVMATEIWTYRDDPRDKRQNTNVCGNCKSSKLDWTSMVMRHPAEGGEFLRKAPARKGLEPIYHNIGFFQCNNCHAFLIGEDNVPFVKLAKNPNGSYHYQAEEPDPLIKNDVEMEAHALIPIVVPGRIATTATVFERIMTGPVLEKSHPLRLVQDTIRSLQNQLEENRGMVPILRKELEVATEKIAKLEKENSLRYTKEEGAKLELYRQEADDAKTRIKELEKIVADKSITTADKIQSFWIFVPKKKVVDLVAVIDKMNWDKKQLGFSIQTDGKFAQTFKVGEPT